MTERSSISGHTVCGPGKHPLKQQSHLFAVLSKTSDLIITDDYSQLRMHSANACNVLMVRQMPEDFAVKSGFAHGRIDPRAIFNFDAQNLRIKMF